MDLKTKLQFLKQNELKKCMNKNELLSEHDDTWKSNGVFSFHFPIFSLKNFNSFEQKEDDLKLYNKLKNGKMNHEGIKKKKESYAIDFNKLSEDDYIPSSSTCSSDLSDDNSEEDSNKISTLKHYKKIKKNILKYYKKYSIRDIEQDLNEIFIPDSYNPYNFTYKNDQEYYLKLKQNYNNHFNISDSQSNSNVFFHEVVNKKFGIEIEEANKSSNEYLLRKKTSIIYEKANEFSNQTFDTFDSNNKLRLNILKREFLSPFCEKVTVNLGKNNHWSDDRAGEKDKQY